MATAYSYIRFSSAKQELGDSLARQAALSENYAAEHGLVIDTSLRLRDLGVSAFNKNNVESGALKGFLDAVRSGQVKPESLLLVESLDRLSRAEVMDALEVFTSIINAGITIVTLADNQTYSRESIKQNWGQLILSIAVMSRAHEESLTKSKRIGAAWAAKRERASSEKMTRRCPSWMELTEDRKTFVLRSQAVRVIKRIIKMSREGFGQAAIARMLNEEGLPNISGLGNGWQSSFINKILSSPALYGEAQFALHRNGKRTSVGEPLPGYYPAIISKKEWQSLQQVRSSRHTGGGGPSRSGRVTNLFSGLLRCGYCRGTMTIGGYSRKDPIKHKKYIVCSTAKRGAGCTFVQWSIDALEPLVLKYMRELNVVDLIEEATTDRTLQTLQARKDAIKLSLDNTKAKLAAVTEAIEIGGNLKTLLSRMSELEGLLASLEVEQQSIEDRIRREGSTDASIRIHQDALAALKALEHTEDKNRVNAIRLRLAANLNHLIKAIYVYAGGTNVKTEYDSAGNPMSHQLVAVDRSTRLVLIWFRAGSSARQVIDGSTSGRSDSFDLHVPTALFLHTSDQIAKR